MPPEKIAAADRYLYEREPADIVQEAIEKYAPVAYRVGFSGGRDSLAVTHWMMNNVPGTEVFHCNTGIGIEKTREFVRETCKQYGWPLHEIRAKEDCGQDYAAAVVEHGFPGPGGHYMMYARLKERPIRLLVKRAKEGQSRRTKVLLATGIRHEESSRRTRYVGQEVHCLGGQLWVSPMYWWSAQQRDEYIAKHRLPSNPVSALLGMSGECLCGAFAHKGELSLVRLACPATADRIERLEKEVRAAGHDWGWEESPPKKKKIKDPGTYRPLCVGCEKEP